MAETDTCDLMRPCPLLFLLKTNIMVKILMIWRILKCMAESLFQNLQHILML